MPLSKLPIMPVSVRRITLLLVLVFLTACGARGASSAATEGASVRVRNLSTSQMTIYAVSRAGQRIRVGTVMGISTETLPIRRSIIGAGQEIRFIASPLAGRAATSFSMYVSPGEEVTITIPSTVR